MEREIADINIILQKISDVTHVPIGVFKYGTETEGVYVTEDVKHILGLSEEEAENLFDDRNHFEEWLKDIYKNPVEGEENIYSLPGEQERYIKIEKFSQGQDIFGIIADRTSAVYEKKQQSQAPEQDVLTGLDNRRVFYTKMERLFIKPEALKYGSLVMVNVDGLNSMNSRYGRECGDRCLCKIGIGLSSIGAPGQVTARLGGDEFVILMHGIDSRNAAEQYVNKLQFLRENESMYLMGNNRVDVRFSMGVSRFPEEGFNWHYLMRMADERMRQEKEERKNQ